MDIKEFFSRPIAPPKLVPFGKYKGKTPDLLLKDASYAKWLKAQPWLSGWLRDLLWSFSYCDDCQDDPKGIKQSDGTYKKCEHPVCGMI